ncbi:putative baseplate assembly protein [Oscillochloris sp. ZM17-4]|uniref:putative baseplate assembly protein n=1 Tax=Oscillochloris sp. ZM17-4 TaxID=2866714 RepID=UPI001C73BA27|nr:putative baseplate assembly protein [Oscillochloris sp. ZM17-4]MBX0331214.1 putative baseplate assembly protein [Oscillochloris sp. ZM17-4]
MSLTSPKLDERSAQDLVNMARAMIPTYCPRWTDHNVSDPGITLIEIFAAMGETLIHRVNQIPDRLQLQMLALLGLQRRPPQAAEAELTFYLTAAQTAELEIAAGLEVATRRSVASPEVIFTTSAPLLVRPPRLKALATENASRHTQPGGAAFTPHMIGPEGQLLRDLAIFPAAPSAPEPDDAFYIGLHEDAGGHVLYLAATCQAAANLGVMPRHPPLRWQACCHHAAGPPVWADCAVDEESTGGFTESGRLRLHVPQGMVSHSVGGVSAYWLRCQISSAAPDNRYQRSPILRELRVEAWGATVSAAHAQVIVDERLGVSDGAPGQRFQLRHSPVLALDEQQDYLIVEHEGLSWAWQQVADFSRSGPDDPHYTLDPIDGALCLGPALLQPDGSLRSYGAIPPRGGRLRFTRYRHGGGLAGNVAPGELCVLKQSRAYVRGVVNRERAGGGRDAESLDEAAMRAPQLLRSRDRAITAEDYAFLAAQAPGVARAFCYAPDEQGAGAPALPDAPQPGEVLLIALPEPGGNMRPGQIGLSPDVELALRRQIGPRRPLGIRVRYRAPQLRAVSLSVELRLPTHADESLRLAVRAQVEALLDRYLSPYIGGADGRGWPFGQGLQVGELYAVIQPALPVGFVEAIQLFQIGDLSAPAQRSPVARRLELRPGELIFLHSCSVVFV